MKRMLLCDGYIVEFLHDATENYYEGGTYACRNCYNIKFPPYVLKILKVCLFSLPCFDMQSDYDENKVAIYDDYCDDLLMITMKLVILISIFNHMIIILLSLLPLLFTRRIFLMWKEVKFLCM